MAGAAPTQSATAGSGYVLQIGSYTSEAEANASWQTYKQSHVSVVGFSPDIKAANLGAKGTWYRLRVGPFATLGEANAACAKLKAQGARCFPAKQ
jgi:cell division protein FtsN